MSAPKYRTLETASMTKEGLGRALMGREVRVTETIIHPRSTVDQSTTIITGVVEGVREAGGLPIGDIVKPGCPAAGAYLRGAESTDPDVSTIRVVVEVRMNARDQLNEALDAVDGASDSEIEAGTADDLVKLVRRLLAEGEL